MVQKISDKGVGGVRHRPQSGRPSFMDKENIVKIRTELSTSNTGWSTKEINDLIQKKISVKYHEDHIRHRLLYQWGFRLKVPEKRFVKRPSEKEIKDFKKR